MGKFKDLTGLSFGRLTVISRVDDYVTPSTKRRRAQWLCRCECGTEKVVLGEALTRGLTLSCGCLQKERASEARTTHGLTSSRLYSVWSSINGRCYDPDLPTYHRYGGRGITVCDEWRESFQAFHDWAFANGYDENAPRGQCTIDRIDNDLGYTPDNCRWVTQEVQMNNVSYNHYETYNGETKTVAQWAKDYNIPYALLLDRLNRYGYPIEKALHI